MPPSSTFPPTNRLLLRTVWPFVLAVCLLSASIVVSFEFLSSVRAYVGGESLWSKGQKQALFSLLHYTETQSEEDYRAFMQGIGIPQGDRQARLALERSQPDLEAARQGFLRGGNHPRDIPGMIRLYRYFRDTRLMQESVRAWRQGDEQILRLRELGESLRRRASEGPLSDLEKAGFQEQLHHLDRAVTPLEAAFSNAIAQVSRQLTTLLIAALGGLSVLLLALGLWLSRRLAIQQVTAVQAMAQEYEKNLVFLHSAGDGIHILDAAGNVREASDSFCAMLGYPRDEVLGMNVARWDAGFHHDDIPGKLNELFDDMVTSQFETLHRRRDGSLFEVEINSRSIVLEGNRFLFCSSRDITERKRSEERLRKSERTLADAQKIAHIGNWWLNVATGELQWSDEIYRIFGRRPQEFEPSHERFYDAVHPDDVDAVRTSVDEAFARGIAHSIDHRIVQPDGTVRWVHEEAVPSLDDEGRMLFLEGTVQDITRQKLDETALKESRNLLQAVIDHVPMRVFWKDRQLNYLGCNPRFARDAGRDSPRDLVGRDDYQMGWANEAELYRADDRAVIESGVPRIDYEESQTTPDGKTIWLRTSKVPFRNEAGEVIGVLGIYDDVTEHKLALQRLRESEERFRSLFESSWDAILVQDGPVFIDCNPAALHQIGATHRDQVVGHGPAEFSAEDPADLRVAEVRARERIQAAMDGTPQIFEWLSRRLDGTEVMLEVQLSRMEVGGRPYIQSICRDITARKRVEEELRQHRDELERQVEQRTGELFVTQFAMDKVGIGITWADFDSGRLIYSNRSAAQLLGYSIDEMLQLSVPDIDPKLSAEDFRRIGEEVKRHGQLQLETRQAARDGRLIPVELTIYYHSAPDGNAPKLIAFQTDISQRKKAEQALVQAKEAAEAANRAKSAFLANMSHEIRTPMNAITGMAHLMRSHGLEPEQIRRLDKITVAGQHLLETINAILDLSKIEAGQFVLEQKPLSLHEVVDNVQAMVRPQAEQKGLQFRVEMGAVPAGVGGDATRLQQALLNYAANAVKFTPQGGITVRVEQLEEDEQSVLLRFEVQDTGVGIAVDTVPRLFNAFEQADNSITRNYGGTGLGLAITRNIARLMGGEAGVQSTLGEGSRFWFTCRLQRLRPASVAPEPPPAEYAEAVLTRDFAGTRVLLVEDDPINSEVAGYLLEEIAFDVDTAENGAKAAHLAETNEYALILMDMQMPVMGGLEATRLIRRNGRCTAAPILAMTANAFAEDKAACFAAGMNGFLSKPIDPQQLYEALLKFLSSPNFQDE